MSRLFAVVRREYLTRVRSKAFVIGTVLGPLLLGGVMIGPSDGSRPASRRCAFPSAYPKSSVALPAFWLARHQALISANTSSCGGQR